ncbi:HupE/UreJ family protein [Aphanothece sacrum]|nr:HupE/UreJ family protein [Aphanothece sacrum]
MSNYRWLKISCFITLFSCLMIGEKTLAHHAFEGKTPTNLFEGFVSGLAHPIIGLDHFAFVVASGLLGARLKQGILVPIVFILATMAGTGIHLQEINLPFAEGIIAASVIIFGGLLTVKNERLDASYWSMMVVSTLAMLAGIFHGYAYGESIVGSEMTPLMAYLAGFAMIQLIVALLVFFVGKVMFKQGENKAFSIIRLIGVGISALGFVFLSANFGH